MKKLHPLMFLVAIVLLTSCGPVSKLTKAQAYRGIYEEKPLSVLIMPPINRSTNVDAKEYFHTTLNVPIIDAGYYVVPPFLSMEILKRESAYDSELFIERPSLLAFKEIFGADVALFTIIHKWDKSSIGSTVTIEVEYIIRSTDSGEVLYTRRGTIVYNASVNTGGGSSPIWLLQQLVLHLRNMLMSQEGVIIILFLIYLEVNIAVNTS